MENKPNSAPEQHETLKLSQSSDPHHFPKVLLAGIGAFLVIISALGAGYFLGMGQPAEQAAPSITQVTPTPADSTADWKTYTSPVGLTFLKPSDAIVVEPTISAELNIDKKANQFKNYEMVDGWKIGIMYEEGEDYSTKPQDRAENVIQYEKESNCSVTSLSTIDINNSSGYSFDSQCSNSNTTHYFISKKANYYEIQAVHAGKINEYKQITSKIINSIIFR